MTSVSRTSIGEMTSVSRISRTSCITLLFTKNLNTGTKIDYRGVPLPWYVLLQSFSRMSIRSQLTRAPPIRPLTDRYLLYVQEYLRVAGSNDGSASGPWFYTYNQSIEHPYFASRPGFVQAKVKYQGMVGVMGDRGMARLTWLVNMELGGLVPSAFTTGLMLSVMAYPLVILEETKDYPKKQEDEETEIGEPSAAKGSPRYDSVVATREKALKELQEKLKMSEKRNELLRDECTASLEEKETELQRVIKEKEKEFEHAMALRAELTEMKAKMLEKDEGLRKKDKEIMELRRRLPRVVAEEETEL